MHSEHVLVGFQTIWAILTNFTNIYTCRYIPMSHNTWDMCDQEDDSQEHQTKITTTRVCRERRDDTHARHTAAHARDTTHSKDDGRLAGSKIDANPS